MLMRRNPRADSRTGRTDHPLAREWNSNSTREPPTRTSTEAVEILQDDDPTARQ